MQTDDTPTAVGSNDGLGAAGGLTLKQKQAANLWDHIDEVLPVLEAARAGKWTWQANSRCKYLELRIDMRDGGCIVKDREGDRINPADLARQAHDTCHNPWPTTRPELGEWQKNAIRGA